MNEKESRSRPEAKVAASLGTGLSSRIAGYAAAAGAAGVSMLALASPARAQIVYTPADIPIPQNGDIVQIDLNHDGLVDFSLRIQSYGDFGPQYRWLGLYGGPNDQNGTEPQNEIRFGFAARVNAGAVIGPEQKFIRADDNSLMLLIKSYSGGHPIYACSGPWIQPLKSGYLPLEFDISGQAHFGWARLAAGCFGGRRGSISAILTGYAYNTVPGQPLLAGQEKDGVDQSTLTPGPATLGRLALGSLGLDLWRPKEREFEDRSR